jgi:arabinose-5-phosphate isomerase
MNTLEVENKINRNMNLNMNLNVDTGSGTGVGMLNNPKRKEIDANEILRQARRILDIEAEALRECSMNLGQDFVDSVELIHRSGGRLILTGVGKSGVVAQKIASTMRSVGIPAAFMHPVEAFHGDLGMVIPRDVVIMLSNSGETTEMVNLVPYVKRLGGSVIVMTGNSDSTLGRVADQVMDSSVRREACPLNLAPTASTAVMMGLGDALAIAVAVMQGFDEEIYKRYHPGGALGFRLQTVGDLMHTGDELPIIGSEATLSDALEVISAKGFGVVLIVDDLTGLPMVMGIFTDGDVRRAIQSGMNFMTTSICEVMTRRPRTISSKCLVEEALNCMEESSITSLVATGEKGELAGLVHLHDILRVKFV